MKNAADKNKSASEENAVKTPKNEEYKTAKQTSGSSFKEKCESLLVLVLRGIFGFFEGFVSYFKREAKEVIAFLAEFFSGIPLLFSYLKNKRKKKKSAAKKEKNEKKKKKNKEKKAVKRKKEEEKQAQKEKERAEKEEKAERRAQNKKEKKAERKKTRSLFKSLVPLLLVSAVLLGELAIAGYEAANYILDRISSSPSALTVVYDNGSVRKTFTVSSSFAYGNGGEELYVEFNTLADAFGLLTVGTVNGMRYTAPDGRMLYLENASNSVFVGENRVSLKNSVRFSGGKVYVPSELLKDYMTGLTLSYNAKKNQLTVSAKKDFENSTKKNAVYEKIEFVSERIVAAEQPQEI